jgi:hypothetical protein
MASIVIEALALGEIVDEIVNAGVVVSKGDYPFCYRFTAPRAVLEQMLLTHWGYDTPEMTGEWPEVKARIEEDAPVRIVVDITGGATHAVYSEVKTSVAFISWDKDDINDSQDEKEYFGADGDQVALWCIGSNGGGDEAKIVSGYFDQINDGD